MAEMVYDLGEMAHELGEMEGAKWERWDMRWERERSGRLSASLIANNLNPSTSPSLSGYLKPLPPSSTQPLYARYPSQPPMDNEREREER
jgi:hypothetical protein